jgi:hypothetical protein
MHETARAHIESWIAAWNSHDLEAIDTIEIDARGRAVNARVYQGKPF